MFCGAFIGGAPIFAGYNINGDLADWGVNPDIFHFDLTPNDSIYNAGNYKITYKSADYTDAEHGFNTTVYDFQAMYFDYDSTNFYVAIVTRYNPVGGSGDHIIGDLWIDLTGDGHVVPGSHGIVEGLDYAVFVGSNPLGTVVKINDLATESADTNYQGEYTEWINFVPHDTSPSTNPYYRQGSPWLCTIDPTDPAKASQVLGLATVAFYSDTGFNEYGIEMEIPRSLFGVDADATQIVLHITQWCGNDQDTMFGQIAGEYIPVEVPIPSALILVCIGTCIIGRFRRQTFASRSHHLEARTR
jgi:hypothetical protein